jgi:hypothetical protein
MGSAGFGNAELSSDVARAEQCDAAGQHTEAMNHLVAGVRKGDVEAFTRLGKRLLVGDRSPRRPNDGASMIEEASARGGAEAAALLSVLYSVDASPRRDLQSALESLITAAERGWSPAQAQLRALADESNERGACAGPGLWRQLGATVDLAAWQAPPPATDLSAAPLIRLYPSFIPNAICRLLIDKAGRRLSRALIYEPNVKKDVAHPTRTNSAALFNLLDTDFVCVLTQRRMAACLGVPFRQFEPISVLHYAEGEQITEHFDFVDPHTPDYELEIAQRGQRIVTFLVYLNDDYAAGETEFPEVGVSHKGRSGEGLFFVNAKPDGSADLRTVHAGRPPSGGDKWIVSQFVRDRRTL